MSCMRQSASCSAIKEMTNAMSRTQLTTLVHGPTRPNDPTSNFARCGFGHLQLGSIRQGLRRPLTPWGLEFGACISRYTHACDGKTQVSMVAQGRHSIRGCATHAMPQCVTQQSQPRPSLESPPETKRAKATARLARVPLSLGQDLRCGSGMRLSDLKPAHGNGGTPAVRASRSKLPEFEFSEKEGRLLPETFHGAAPGRLR